MSREAATPLSPDTLTLLRLIVEESGGSILGTPAELEREGRAVATRCGYAWPDLAWPATGLGLVELLARDADQVAAAGLLACHTVEGEPLVGKIEAVLRHLVELCSTGSDGTWSGPVTAVRVAWRRLPGALRDELSGPPWPDTAAPLDLALHRARDELARRGLVVRWSGPGRLSVTAGNEAPPARPACSTRDCDRPHYARGMCQSCHLRARRRGVLLPTPDRKDPS